MEPDLTPVVCQLVTQLQCEARVGDSWLVSAFELRTDLLPRTPITVSSALSSSAVQAVWPPMP